LRFHTASARSRHSPAPSLGHSDVASTQEAAIQFAMVNAACALALNNEFLRGFAVAPAQMTVSKTATVVGVEILLFHFKLITNLS
jgi:hypothetical protein